jgi:hypothetical protein
MAKQTPAERQSLGTSTRRGRYGQDIVVETFATETPGAIIEADTDTWIETAKSQPGTHLRSRVRRWRHESIDGGICKMATWRRVINGKLFSFTRIVMPSGEIRFDVMEHNGYADLRFSCAWTQRHFLIFAKKPPVVTIEVRVADDAGLAATDLGAVREALSELFAGDPIGEARRTEAGHWVVSLPGYVAGVLRHEGYWSWEAENGYLFELGIC